MNTENSSIASSRLGCALQGALVTLAEIQGVVPIVHSSANCAHNRHLADRCGAAGEGAICLREVPSVNVAEKHIIFGGGSRLREQLKNSVKTINGAVYVAIGSCESAMVGDDIIGMARELAEQGQRVLSSDAAGFRGPARQGYAQVFKDIIKSLGKDGAAAFDKPLVNIFGIVPREDVRYKGDLLEIKRIVEALGLSANTFFGCDDGAGQLAQITRASLNIAFTQWGFEISRILQEKYDIPSLFYPSPPIGYIETEKLVNDVTETLKPGRERAQAFLQEEKAYQERFLMSIRERLCGGRFGERVAVAGGKGEVLQICGFLSRCMGAEIAAAVITDTVADGESAGKFFHTADAAEIREILERSGAEVIFASWLEREIADGFVEASYPAHGGAILSKTYTGTRGAATLIEDYTAAVARKNAAKEARLVRQIRENNV